MNLNQVTLPAIDVAASVAFYKMLGFELVVDAPRYARFKSTQGDATFSLHAVTARLEPSTTVVYFECTALDRQVDDLSARHGLHWGSSFFTASAKPPWSGAR